MHVLKWPINSTRTRSTYTPEQPAQCTGGWTDGSKSAEFGDPSSKESCEKTHWRFVIGESGTCTNSHGQTWVVESPIEHGQIKNWDFIERFWQHCIFKYMRCEPEEHCFMCTPLPLKPRSSTHRLIRTSVQHTPHRLAVQ